MSVIGVTGSGGFLGWHLRSRLHTTGRGETLLADRTTFQSDTDLDDFVRGCDVILHLAGVNRGEPKAVAEGNVQIAEALAAAKERTGSSFVLAYANSTKAGEDSPYGQSKQEAADILASMQDEAGDRFVNLVFPHLFGENGRPFYNSGVTTFAHQLATGGHPEIIVDSELELLHAQDAAQAILDALADESVTEVRPSGERIMVSDALAKLRALSHPYLESGHVPEMPTLLDVRLFNMFRSQLYPHHCPIPLVSHRDDRGVFFETIRSHGKGQAAISTTQPGITRGEHFHFDKIERFVVVKGEAIIRIRRLLFEDVHDYRVSGDDPVAIDMPTLHPHNITNISTGELVTQFWTNDLFDPDNPDTIPEPV